MKEKTVFQKNYYTERLLSRSHYSEVWLAKDVCTNVYVALKIYADTCLENDGLERIKEELSIMSNIRHKNLLSPYFYDVFEGRPWAVFPYCKNGNLLEAIGQFSEEQVWMLIRDVSNALSFLHSLHPPKVYQSVKPDNIIIDDEGNYLLTDWRSLDIQYQIKKSLKRETWGAGNCDYLAPERFGRKNIPTIENDIYALGITVYEVLTGNTPFGEYGGQCQKLGASIPDLEGNYSEQLKNSIKQCLALEPWDRPSAQQLALLSETALKGKKWYSHTILYYLYSIRKFFPTHQKSNNSKK